jgi:hypothetical protein
MWLSVGRPAGTVKGRTGGKVSFTDHNRLTAAPYPESGTWCDFAGKKLAGAQVSADLGGLTA